MMDEIQEPVKPREKASEKPTLESIEFSRQIRIRPKNHNPPKPQKQAVFLI